MSYKRIDVRLGTIRMYCRVSSRVGNQADHMTIGNGRFERDEYSNVTKKILGYIGEDLHKKPFHPLRLVRERIVGYFNRSFTDRHRNPLFSVHDDLNPVVTTRQNFDDLLIPRDHVSRAKSDCYYLNRRFLLRAHMTAHQSDLIRSGLNNFLMCGDVYRRDAIDRTHYPVFHQLDGLRLCTREDLFVGADGNADSQLLFKARNTDAAAATIGKQSVQDCHSSEAVESMERQLKSTLADLSRNLFGERCQMRWVDAVFPFTQPSWELEVNHDGAWMELLGCGIVKQEILRNAGVEDRIGWAFGSGLERIAMCLYRIPDIRLFWSKDSGFLNQFRSSNRDDPTFVYKPVSQFPQCTNDISFWLPENESGFSSNDFYDLVRSAAADIIEQVTLIDEFRHPKTGTVSHCYRIVYRHMEKTLTQKQVNGIHSQIEKLVASKLGVTVRH